jgi:hypothetical protein
MQRDYLRSCWKPFCRSGSRDIMLLSWTRIARFRTRGAFCRPTLYYVQHDPIHFWTDTVKRVYALCAHRLQSQVPTTLLNIQSVALFLESKYHMRITYWNKCSYVMPLRKVRSRFRHKCQDVKFHADKTTVTVTMRESFLDRKESIQTVECVMKRNRIK